MLNGKQERNQGATLLSCYHLQLSSGPALREKVCSQAGWDAMVQIQRYAGGPSCQTCFEAILISCNLICGKSQHFLYWYQSRNQNVISLWRGSVTTHHHINNFSFFFFFAWALEWGFHHLKANTISSSLCFTKLVSLILKTEKDLGAYLALFVHSFIYLFT